MDIYIEFAKAIDPDAWLEDHPDNRKWREDRREASIQAAIRVVKVGFMYPVEANLTTAGAAIKNFEKFVDDMKLDKILDTGTPVTIQISMSHGTTACIDRKDLHSVADLLKSLPPAPIKREPKREPRNSKP